MLKNKKKIIIGIVLISLAILASSVWEGQNISEGSLGRRDGAGQRKFSVENFRADSGNILSEPNIIQTELSFTATEESTVYDLMQKLKAEGKINFAEKNFAGLGKFIESINGIRSNGEKTWIYYVNGKKAEVGVSNYKLKPGDVVTWQYEKMHY